MRTSDDLKELAAALAKAQGEMTVASKDGTNPHFGKTYATLASASDAVRAPLSKNGIAVYQAAETDEQNNAVVITRLIHSSGQWLESRIAVRPTKPDAQGIGSALTYCRRYSLMAACGIAPGDDDDGNAAVGMPKNAPRPVATEKPLMPPMPEPPPREPEGVQTYVTFENIDGLTADYAMPGEVNSVVAAVVEDMSLSAAQGKKQLAESALRHRHIVEMLDDEHAGMVRAKAEELGLKRRAPKKEAVEA